MRENQPEPGDEEQTWPSEQELLDVEKLVKGKARRRKLPAGEGRRSCVQIAVDWGLWIRVCGSGSSL